MFDDLDVGAKSNTIVIPFATAHAHWKVVVLRGVKGENGRFNYQACEIDTDGISRPVGGDLLGIFKRVADPEASVQNQVIAEEVAFDYQLQYNQNCSSAVAMMTSALKDQAIEKKPLNLDQFLSAEDKAILDKGKAAQSIVKQESMEYDDMELIGVFKTIDFCDEMLREAVFKKMSRLPLSADCWADTCIEGLRAEGRESLDFSGMELAYPGDDARSHVDGGAPASVSGPTLPDSSSGEAQVVATQHARGGVGKDLESIPGKQVFKMFKEEVRERERERERKGKDESFFEKFNAHFSIIKDLQAKGENVEYTLIKFNKAIAEQIGSEEELSALQSEVGALQKSVVVEDLGHGTIAGVKAGGGAQDAARDHGEVNGVVSGVAHNAAATPTPAHLTFRERVAIAAEERAKAAKERRVGQGVEERPDPSFKPSFVSKSLTGSLGRG